MRTPNRLAKFVLAAALGSMALTACGTADATGKPGAKAPAVGVGASAKPKQKPAATPTPPRMIPSDALATHPDPEVRILALVTRITNECAPGTMPELPALPAVDDISAPVDPEGQPPRSPEPLPLPTDIPEPPSSEPTGPAEEVSLGPVDKCGGDAHAERIRKAFDGESPADYAELRKKLTALDYLPESIHRMPDRGGEPRARIDLRDMSMSDNLVLEVTGTARGVTAEYFGVPVSGDVKITEVKRKP
ncbi:hypothetical protein ACFQ7J_33170 [Streptomyces sp. NPDC056501]|uniref:hypothetical protein n=1 Tax=Streptomyces sp. NPDC056501 TaxID=3345841 RepID=UPI0036ACB64F